MAQKYVIMLTLLFVKNKTYQVKPCNFIKLSLTVATHFSFSKSIAMRLAKRAKNLLPEGAKSLLSEIRYLEQILHPSCLTGSFLLKVYDEN